MDGSSCTLFKIMQINLKSFFPLLLQSIAWPIARILFWILCDFEVFGYKKISHLPKGVIFAINHTSHLDPIAIRAALPWFSRFSPMYYVAREQKIYDWKGWKGYLYGDTFFNIWGAYPAYPGKQDYFYSLRNFISIGKTRQSITIFPFGIEKLTDPEPKKPRGGVVFLSHYLQLPVVPVYITECYHASFSTFFKARLTIKVVFGDPIYYHKQLPEFPLLDDYKQAAIVLGDKIKSLKYTISSADVAHADTHRMLYNNNQHA